MYSSGKILLLSWNGSSLSTKWETRKMGGPVVGYCIKDVDNDDKPEIVMSVLKNTSGTGMFRSPKSQLIFMDIE
ncbi:hypothetical protein ACFL0H_15030 [Thermodesulfobacteriota bacterium]